ncbi:DedA family protein [Alicyclobacillus dauci]|uniref:DedA family protein n=1 Tax=Alicyclobacillus dauci TaxID=1475485 RepID=A0ABY6YYM8_9BACL|nr:DedA family protein [Alicyclobacillus dauci]WAH35730.1 DedA family protein [Alicyclobacillus dauci]
MQNEMEDEMLSGLNVLISHHGNIAIFLLMALESTCIPIPSEVVMPFAGYLAYVHTLSFWPVVIIGTIANVVGGLIAYAIGLYGGRPFIQRFGKYVLLSPRHMDKAEHWFQKYGEVTVFFGRMVPAVRTFVSLPAGIARMPIWRFIIFSALGSLPWNFAMVYAGFQLHAHYAVIAEKLKPLTYVGAAILVIAVLWFWFSRRKGTQSRS